MKTRHNISIRVFLSRKYKTWVHNKLHKPPTQIKAKNKSDNFERSIVLQNVHSKPFVTKQVKKAGFCLHTIGFNQAHGLQKTLEAFLPIMKRRLFRLITLTYKSNFNDKYFFL